MTHTLTARPLARLIAAGLIGTALLVPATASANGNPPAVECAGYAHFLKIDGIGGGGIAAGSYTSGTASVETNWTGQTITISDVTGGGQAFSWASTLAVSQVVSKEGSDEFVTVTGLPGTSGSVADHIQQGLSHVTFCGNGEPEATATPEPEATATAEPEATATAEPEATATAEPEATATPEPEATATPEPEATATPDPTPTPAGTVAAATSKPRVTPPSTDATVGGGSGSGGNGLGMVLLVLGGLALAASILRPAGKRIRR